MLVATKYYWLGYLNRFGKIYISKQKLICPASVISLNQAAMIYDDLLKYMIFYELS